MAMRVLRVEMGNRSYPVMVGDGILANAGHRLKRLGFSEKPVLVSNRRVLRLHGRTLLAALEKIYGPIPKVLIGDGERFKNQATLDKIHDGLFQAHADRRSWVLAFGGGVVGDVAGFAAATFLRGIPFVSIPTTLLAQVDSSVGGKVGINIDRGKNLIGAFHQPSAVLSDTATLRTLPARELASGLFEVVKCAVIRSEPLLRYLERNLDAVLRCESSALAHVIMEAVRIKAGVVSGDEREAHTRMILNFGHTIGHALEAAASYRTIRHGEAVAWGMIAAARLSRALRELPATEEQRLVHFIRRIGPLPSLRGISPADSWRALKRDKKSRGGEIRMVLLRHLGQPEIVDRIDATRLRAFLGEFLTGTHGA